MRKIYAVVSRQRTPQRRVSKWVSVASSLLAGTFLVGCAGVVSSTKSTSPQPMSKLQIVTTALPAATANQVYTASLGASGGVLPYSWSIGSGNLPTGVALTGTGTIAGTTTTTGVFNLSVKLSDSSDPPQTANAALSLEVNAAVPTLQITTPSLPSALESSSYTAQLAATGGSGSLTWSLASGQLPSGVSLNPTSGLLSGTPTQSGTFSFATKVQDSEATPQTATKSLSLSVAPPSVPQLQITSTSVPSAVENSVYSDQLTATGGSGTLHWSIAEGQLPSGITLNVTSGLLSGTATQSGSFSFTAQVQDSESTPQTATKSLSLSVSAPSGGGTGGGTGGGGSGSSSPPYYGSGIAGDALSNQELVQIGGDNYLAAYRFRAAQTGSIQAVHFYLIVNKPGYSGGNGGEVKVDLESDDGSAAHNPSGKVLATYTIANPQAGLTGPDSGEYGYFPTVTFASPAAVTQGQLYHVVFSNPSANPSVNFVSLDSLWLDLPSTPVQPTVSDTDSAVLRMVTGTGGFAWKQQQTLTPILQVDYADGTTAGQGYMEVWVGAPEPISGTAAVREQFTNNSGANIAVTSVSVRVNRTSGTAALTVRLEQSDGTLIEQGTVAAASIPVAADPTWVTYTFSAVRTLFSAQGYNLVLEAPSGTTYTAYPVRKGSAYGFAPATTYFNDGYAQFNPGSGWVGWTQWGATNRTDGDLQFYFTTTP